MNKLVTSAQLELERPLPKPLGSSAQQIVESVLAKACPKPKSDSFDWEADADCVILKEQPATAIYHGSGGHIVIRQTNGHEEDVTILIAPENANTFMDGVAEFLRRE